MLQATRIVAVAEVGRGEHATPDKQRRPRATVGPNESEQGPPQSRSESPSRLRRS
jgi:hypothetical protein